MDSILRDKQKAMKGTVDINKAENPNIRTVHTKEELFGHPHFSKVRA